MKLNKCGREHISLTMNQKQKLPVINTILIVGLSVSFALILVLVAFNFVVINKMDEVQPFMKMFSGQSHFSTIKQESASKIIKVLQEKRNLLITSQFLGFIILVMIALRLMLVLISLYPPLIGSKFSFMRRIYLELVAVFQEGGTSDGLVQDVSVSGELKKGKMSL